MVDLDVCARCGADPAEGWALIGTQRYCHGDIAELTCYELQQHAALDLTKWFGR